MHLKPVVLFFSSTFMIIWVVTVWVDSIKHENVVIDSSGRNELVKFISIANSQQKIYNEDLFGSSVELVIIVQVHNRTQYLQELINSLERSLFINTTLLVFSHDLIDTTINAIVQKITFAKYLQIFYPFSVQTHPSTFPGPDESSENPATDSYGHTRAASLGQVKLHWWWKANFLFKQIRALEGYSGLVLFQEEDHYMAPDFIHCLRLMESSKLCPSCWFYSLGLIKHVNFQKFSDKVIIKKNFESTGFAFNRTIWERISSSRELFCRYDDYNWDWSLKYLYRKLSQEKSTIVLRAARVLHIGSCGIHTKSKSCSPTKAIEDFEHVQVNLFPESLSIDSTISFAESQIMKYGGWGDPRDQELCLSM